MSLSSVYNFQLIFREVEKTNTKMRPSINNGTTNIYIYIYIYCRNTYLNACMSLDF